MPARKRIKYKVDSNGCHICISHKTRCKGYVSLFMNGKRILGHRYTFQKFHKKQIPKDLIVRHKCDNRECMNPSHLELGTIADNNQDTIERGKFVRCYGERNGNHKLSNEQVMKIQSLILQGLSCRNIAKIFCCSHTTILAIKNKKRSGFESHLPHQRSWRDGGIGRRTRSRV